ncbi:GNAT family N-acetyltransferase [Mycolicibacterium sp.]|jgi:ribosomal protein S18 acetylase RimI-like enzyme|uniref:GNAT family N-acetyltransferase n=1 Tax=Mycolicibacterium sp. TaxID=2320850 RepID=UPI0028B09EAB|nr:GNAT family N-acetyltransferase [Mycolicibacterium sp.]
MAISVTPARGTDAAELADVAATTFPLACPPAADPADIAAHIAAHLSAGRFAEHLADRDRIVLVAREDGRIVGYAMLVRGVDDDPDIGAAVGPRPAAELSKMYVLATHHRSGAAAALMQAGLDWATADGAAAVWLGVNRNNQRAQRFYGKHGFAVTGTRTFRLGNGTMDDVVMVRPV